MSKSMPSIGPKLNAYIEKYVDPVHQYDAKVELDDIIQELLLKIFK